MELLVYSKRLNDTQVKRINAYLSRKWLGKGWKRKAKKQERKMKEQPK